MTAGHRHRHIRVPRLVQHLLQTPLATSRDRIAVRESRWVWGERVVPARPGDLGGTEYVLTPLGILHTLFGITIVTK